MKCPKCKTDLTRKQEYALIYGKDGEHQITCQKCKHEFVVVRRFHRTKPENACEKCVICCLPKSDHVKSGWDNKLHCTVSMNGETAIRRSEFKPENACKHTQLGHCLKKWETKPEKKVRK